MNRAYVVLNVKDITEERDFYVVRGVATTPTADILEDIVEPLGARYKMPMPLLWQHQTDKPVGTVNFANPTKDGIGFEARIPNVKEPGVLKDRIDEAIQSIKYRLVAAVSIGFKPIKDQIERLKSGGTRFLEWTWLELSLVTIPANSEATITSIKSIDQAQMRAASGTARTVALSGSPPGVTGKSTSTPRGTIVKTIKEQIEGFENKRAASDARMASIMDAAGDEGRTLEPTEKEEYDNLNKEVGEVDDHLVRLRQRETQLVKTATPITSVSGNESDTATKLRNGINVVQMGKRNLPAGIPWTRFAMVQAMAKGNLMQAEVLSRRFDDSTPEVGLACKAAVAAGTTQDATWASPLVQLVDMQSEFIEFLRPLTVLGRIPNLRRVPFNIQFTRQTAGTTGTFVGEGLPKPLGKMDFELLSLKWAKAATIIVMTQELVRFSNPSAELLARDDLGAGIARYLDLRFLDPIYAGVANVSPASITNGVTPTASLGTTVALITDTIKIALQGMATANLDMQGLVWVMSPAVAISLGLKRTSQDIFGFPGLTGAGGTFFGYPVITSNNMALSGSPTESFIVLLDPREIMLADDGGVQIDMSTEASVEMDGAPAGGATSLVSLWQNNLVGLRAERFINWRKRRDAAVAVITMNVVW